MHRYSKARLFSIIMLFALFVSIAPFSCAFATDSGVTNAKVVMRKTASKNSLALQTLPAGETVSVLQSTDGWYKVRYGNYTGYIMEEYIDLSNDSLIANQDKISALGSAPGALYIGDEGSDVKKLQNALKILGYYALRVDGIYGEGTTTAVALYQQAKDLEPDGIAGKQTISSMFGSCAKSADITVSGRDAEQKIAQTKSSTDSSAQQKNMVSSFSDIKSVPAASKEGDSGSKVVKLQQALYLLGYYTGTIDGDYGEATKQAVTKFQEKRGMNADGIAGAATIRVMFSGTGLKTSSSSSVKTYKTKVLDWFKDHVTNVIPKNAKFTIKDVRTGKTFTAVRWSGINHLDAEPASADDTEIFKSIYGGSWSWSRRPILILYRGNVYAASMNGMPHGTTTIDNDFDGHFCIHFKNSKTHGTEVVDADHQKAVDVASHAVW
ncbi:MAG TPA: peptidoglycan-binding protein [Candidatus Limiplasma sp.]|nr:peptidoglycan-binding protein [Candidatus Limiplasma sp.]HRX07938.1 peptidoglycan-binding protein [Candidatus Limiplasma sp.]